jgi:hypothetical protein
MNPDTTAKASKQSYRTDPPNLITRATWKVIQFTQEGGQGYRHEPTPQ